MQQQLQHLQPIRCRHQQHVTAQRLLLMQRQSVLQQPWPLPVLNSRQQQWLPPALPVQQQLHRLQQQPQHSSCSSRHGYSTVCRSAASEAAFDDGRSNYRRSSPSSATVAAAAQLAGQLQDTARDFKDVVSRFVGLWRSFLPMLSLFFCLSFVNTMLDSLKDTLVITAHGGGAFVIPYLTVYAVLPISVVFLFLFSAASHRMSRAALFNAIIVVFMAFFGSFALFMYPNADVLHPHAFADQLQQALPQGLAGFVGMLRNWTFTLFFCMSELWGDVCMGLLFWGLANEITSLSDAATLYPLFGLGANLAQALAGVVLKATTCGGAQEFGQALQMSMAAVIGIAGFAIFLQQKITNDAEAAAAKRRHHRRHNSANPPGSSSSSSSSNFTASEQAAAAAAMKAADAAAEAQWQQQQLQKRQEKAKSQPSAWESIKVLGNSLEIRCLAVMSLAQGLCNSLMEFAWKCHMRILYPSPADFTAFLGDVATWSGVVTGGLMLLSPLLFERWGWRGVANATPNIFLFGGSAFFVACIVYQHLYGVAVAAGGAAAAGPASLALLQGLVMSGALLYVFGKGAKFSLFKPAEEMVYITLDEDGRTRGKAAIDVVGAQTGKSGGSLLQQALLLISAGSITGIMPIMFGVFFLMLRGWRSAVHDLSQVRHYSYDSPTTSMEEEEDEDDSSESGRLSPAAQQQLQQKLKGLGSAAAAAGADVPLDNVESIGTKSYQSAVARTHLRSSSNGRDGGSSSSSSTNVAGNGEHHTAAAAAGGESVSDGHKAGRGRGGKILLSGEAAAAFGESFAMADDGGLSSLPASTATSSSSSSNDGGSNSSNQQ